MKVEIRADESLAGIPNDYENEMRAFIRSSIEVWRGEVDGELICMWGLVASTLMSNRAYLWMYTADAADDHSFVLVRHSQIQIQRMLRVFPVITGHCDATAWRSIRWLKWLGAKFGDPIGLGVPFRIERHG